MPWGGIIGAIVGAGIQDGAITDAAGEQRLATENATAEQRRQYEQTRQDLAPWRGAGQQAVNRLSWLLGMRTPQQTTGDPDLLAAQQAWDNRRMELEAQMRPGFTSVSANTAYPVNEFDQVPATVTNFDTQGFTNALNSILGPRPTAGQGQFSIAGQNLPESEFGSLNRQFSYQDFLNDPVTKASFDFGLEEGRKALGAQMRATGLRNSGAELKALTRYGTDYAGQKAGESFNRFNVNQSNQYNRLANLAGLGQTSAQQTANIGMQTGQNLANIGIGNANAQGAARIAQGNIWGNTLSGLGNWWSQQQMVNSLNQNPYGGGNYYTPNYGYGQYGDWAAPG